MRRIQTSLVVLMTVVLTLALAPTIVSADTTEITLPAGGFVDLVCQGEALSIHNKIKLKVFSVTNGKQFRCVHKSGRNKGDLTINFSTNVDPVVHNIPSDLVIRCTSPQRLGSANGTVRTCS